MTSPLTPMGAQTPEAHPALRIVVAVLVIASAVGIFLALAYLQGWWPFPEQFSVSPTPTPVVDVSYRNDVYGFVVTLPASWRGFTVRTDTVQAYALASGSQSGTFPEIHIGHPLSTTEIPRQDIPIMVFTTAQWDGIVHEELSVGAAPIPPSALASNSAHVFALPARYNYAFPEGWEEVQAILNVGPVSAFEPLL